MLTVAAVTASEVTLLNENDGSATAVEWTLLSLSALRSFSRC